MRRCTKMNNKLKKKILVSSLIWMTVNSMMILEIQFKINNLLYQISRLFKIKWHKRNLYKAIQMIVLIKIKMMMISINKTTNKIPNGEML